MIRLSASEASESLENNEPDEVSVSVDPWLGGRAMSNMKLVRELEWYVEGTRSRWAPKFSSSTPCGIRLQVAGA